MIEDSNNKPRSKMNALLSGGDEKKPVGEKASPLSRLPKKTDTSFLSGDATQKISPALKTTSRLPTTTQKSVSQTPQHDRQNGPVPVSSTPPARVSRGLRLRLGPPFWTITGIISLLVNAVLIALLVGLFLNYRSLQLSSITNLSTGLLGGLYTNFELMDRAHITTTIPVQSTIPVKFDLPLNQQTNVVLSQDVTVDNVLVTVQTGGLNITRARSTIVLPQGTNLPVFLNLTVPVDTTVPVTLSVPVDIALQNTELHKPFSGLQDVVRPFYCLTNKSAVNLDGVPICP